MIVFVSMGLGGFLGYRSAAKRGGNGRDIAQYAFVYGMLFAVIGLVITIVIHRLAA